VLQDRHSEAEFVHRGGLDRLSGQKVAGPLREG
jgi:hypothetical protein